MSTLGGVLSFRCLYLVSYQDPLRICASFPGCEGFVSNQQMLDHISMVHPKSAVVRYHTAFGRRRMQPIDSHVDNIDIIKVYQYVSVFRFAVTSEHHTSLSEL